MNTALKCLDCEETFTTEDTVSVGGLPNCGECGGELTIPGVLEISCCNCEFTQTVKGINVNECSACPKCGWALDVKSQDLEVDASEDVDETIQKETDYVDPDATLATESPQVIPEAEQHIEVEASAMEGVGETIAIESEHTEEDDEYAEETYSPTGTVIKEQSESQELKIREEDSQSTGLKDKKFGKYDIISEIARGGMGIVYRVMDSDLRRELALKVLIAGEDASEELLKRFMREARAAAQLNHPNVVPVHEVGQIDNQYYFTMDLIEGTSFDKIIASKWMPVNELVGHLRDISQALKAAHDNNIIHRDIKPANIMFDAKNERALLTDFGLAKDMDSNTMLSMTGMMMGSPAYMSPEQARGMIHQIDHRADIYSIGVVLFEAVTGEQPFSGSTIVETVRKVVYDDPIPPRKLAPEKVSNDLQNIILKCLEKEADNRYQEMQELINDLNAYLDGSKVQAKPPPMMAIYWRKLKRKPILLSSIVGSPFAAALLIFLAWYLFLAPKPLDLAEEAISSNDPRRQAGAISDIDSWIKSKRFSEPDEMRRILNLLNSCLADKDEKVTIQACLTLEQLGDPRAVPPIVALLKKDGLSDKTITVAIAALRTLATNKKADKELINKTLTGIAVDKIMPGDLRRAAIHAVVEAWGEGTMKAIMGIAKDENEDIDIRIAAIQAMEMKLTLGSPSMYEVIRLSSNKDPRIKKTAQDALKNSRSHASILGLYGLKERASVVNKELSGVLQKHAKNQQDIMNMINEMNPEVKKEKTPFEVISEKLRDKSAETRLAAAYDIGELGDGKAVSVLVGLLTDEDPDVVSVAAQSIVKLSPTKPDTKKLIPLLKNPGPVIREQAVYLIGESGDPLALEMVILKAKDEENMLVIAMIAETLKKAERSKALPLLDDLLKKSAEKSNTTAISCIKSMQSFGKPAARHLIPYLKSTNQNIKNAALAALSEMSGREYGDDIEKWKKWGE